MMEAVRIAGTAARRLERQVETSAADLVRSGTEPQIDRGTLATPPEAMPNAVAAATGMVVAQQGFGLNLAAVRTADEMLGTLLDVIA